MVEHVFAKGPGLRLVSETFALNADGLFFGHMPSRRELARIPPLGIENLGGAEP
jgi:hypothetical protein